MRKLMEQFDKMMRSNPGMAQQNFGFNNQQRQNQRPNQGSMQNNRLPNNMGNMPYPNPGPNPMFRQQMPNPQAFPQLMNPAMRNMPAPPFQMYPPMQPMMMQPPMMNPMMMGSNPMMAPNQVPQQAQRPNQQTIEWVLSNKAEFAKQGVDQQKRTLGAILYPLVEKKVSDKTLTPKVTGMLIDLEVLTVDEIIETITNPKELADRIQEAVQLIEEEGQQENHH